MYQGGSKAPDEGGGRSGRGGHLSLEIMETISVGLNLYCSRKVSQKSQTLPLAFSLLIEKLLI